MRNKSTEHSNRRRPKRADVPSETERTQLRRLVAHLQDAREEESLRIIHAVHDELLSRLVRTSMDLGELRRRSHDRACASRFIWMNAAQHLKEAIQIAAGVRARLRPPLLDHCGLEAAMAWTASEWTKHHGHRCEVVRATNLSRISPVMALELFRLFEEGLCSLTENCEPAHLRIEIARRPAGHCLTLHHRALAVNAGYNLVRSPAFLSVRERARRLGGKLVLLQTPPSKISLAITVPAGSQRCPRQIAEH